jgi:hypothetical protein
MKIHELLLIAVVVFLIYKRVEGYLPVEAKYRYGGELSDYNIPGGRPAEFFMKFSPNDWAPRSPDYVFDPTVEMDM